MVLKEHPTVPSDVGRTSDEGPLPYYGGDSYRRHQNLKNSKIKVSKSLYPRTLNPIQPTSGSLAQHTSEITQHTSNKLPNQRKLPPLDSLFHASQKTLHDSLALGSFPLPRPLTTKLSNQEDDKDTKKEAPAPTTQHQSHPT